MSVKVQSEVYVIDWIEDECEESSELKKIFFNDLKKKNSIVVPWRDPSATKRLKISEQVAVIDELLLSREHPVVLLMQNPQYRGLLEALRKKKWLQWVERDAFFFFGVLPDVREKDFLINTFFLSEQSDVDKVITRIWIFEDTKVQRGFSRVGYYMRRKIVEYAKQPADPNIPRLPVLILGASRTGKEVVADALLAAANLKDDKYEKVACGSLTASLLEDQLFGHWEGAFTDARSNKEGILECYNAVFLDDIDAAEPPKRIQGSLLRFLAERPPKCKRLGLPPKNIQGSKTVNTWLLVSTNRAPQELIDNNEMREDFILRFVHFIFVPPFSERRNDIPFIALSIERALNECFFHQLDLNALRWLRDRNSTWQKNATDLQIVLLAANEAMRDSDISWVEALNHVSDIEFPFYDKTSLTIPLAPPRDQDFGDSKGFSKLKSALNREISSARKPTMWRAIDESKLEHFVTFIRSELLAPSCKDAFNELYKSLCANKNPAPVQILKILAVLILATDENGNRRALSKNDLMRFLNISKSQTLAAANLLTETFRKDGLPLVERKGGSGSKPNTYRIVADVLRDP